MITGSSKLFILTLVRLRVAIIAIFNIRSLTRSFQALRYLDFLGKKYAGSFNPSKGFKANGRYFLFNHVPGFPSKAFDTFHKEELNLLQPFNSKARKLRSVILAITNKCPLNCEHCYESELLNKQERLSLENLKAIIAQLQGLGVTQIYLSGGEPLARFNHLLDLLYTAKKGTDFWLITSGTKLTAEKARQLKQTGRLTGVSVSLDHFLPDQHNAFRKRSYSYEDAVCAVKNCLTVNLAVGLAICTTKSFVSWDNLMRYAEKAKELGVHFIQLQEPYAVGSYAGKDVTLSDEQILILDHFYKEMNCNEKYKHFPMVVFHGFHQRRIGCFGGKRYFYIDADGNIHSCPYCRSSHANVLNDSLEQYIQETESDCLSFSNFNTPVHQKVSL